MDEIILTVNIGLLHLDLIRSIKIKIYYEPLKFFANNMLHP